jgi:glycerophosphoryl diester phosphodiesterase
LRRYAGALIVSAMGRRLGSIKLAAAKMHPRSRNHSIVHVISAHRGGTEGVEPNTLRAYRKAAAGGIEYVEFDVHRTRDRKLVVFHEERTPSGVPLHSLSLQELRAEVGRNVPCIEEVMEAVRGRSLCQIDLKEVGYERDVVDIALALVGRDGFVVTTLEDESVLAIKKAYPDIRVGLSLGRNMSGASLVDKVKVWRTELFPGRRVRSCGADFLALRYDRALLSGLRFCAKHHMAAFVWTVNDDKRLRRVLRDSRVECVITDVPLRAQRLRRLNGPQASMVRDIGVV